MAKIEEAQLREALVDADFPADKESLLAHAERNGAGEGVRQELRALPPVSYHNFGEVLASVTTHEAVGEPSASDKAERQRSQQGQRGHISEHLRDAESKANRILSEEEPP